MARYPRNINIALLIVSLFATVYADWPIHPKDRDPALNLYLGSEPPIAPNTWRYGKTIVTLSDSGRTLTASGNGTMANYDAITMGSIPPPWYDSRNNIISVVIDDGVTTIGDGAFIDCENLTSITIPNSVVSIGKHSFSGCINLTSITIPNSMTTIGLGAFSSCDSLTSFTIPNGITSIASMTFMYCANLKTITIPKSVTSIGELAFRGCTSLTSITIPNSVATIDYSAFWMCTNLTSIFVQRLIPPKISPDAFDEITTSNAGLYVPKGSLDAYRTVDVWKDFKCIQELSNGPAFGVWIVLGISIGLILSAGLLVIIKKTQKNARQ